MIRGAIAFGLVLRLDKNLPNRSVIVTTSLLLVLATTLLFGTLLPFLSKMLLSTVSEEPKDEGKELQDVIENNKEKSHSEVDNQSSESFHDLLIHPNFESASQTIVKDKKRKSSCVQYFKKFDEAILRPILIYKYSKQRKEREYEIYEEMKHKGKPSEHIAVSISKETRNKKNSEIKNEEYKNHEEH